MRQTLGLLSMVIMSACFKPNHPDFQSIYPLEPTSSMVDMLDSTGRFQSRQLTEFYLVYGNISDGTFMRRLLLEFAKSHFDTTLIKLPILYQLKFYQASAKATISSVKFARNEAGYTEEDCFAVITFDEHGRHQITLSKQTMP